MSTETTTPEVRAARMQSEVNQRRAIAKYVCRHCRPDFLRWGLIDHEDWEYEACDTELCRGCLLARVRDGRQDPGAPVPALLA